MRALAVAVFLFVVALVSVAGRTPAQIPQKFTNLQVLPKDITGQNLILMMKGFTRALGVRCPHCHLGEGDDLSKFDFASDARPAKATARAMLKMTASLSDTVKGVGEPSAEPKINCYTCHRGATKPLTAPAGGRGGGRRTNDLLVPTFWGSEVLRFGWPEP